MGQLEQKNKYYIPEIEEFHIGFEFELSIKTWEANKNPIESWQKVILGTKSIGNDLFIGDSINRKEIQNTSTRVKYLDKEDIEELGFKYLQNIQEIEYYSNNNNDNLIYNPLKDYIYLKTEFTNFNIFSGIIKNKSEFKKLLTQLEIE